MPYYEFECEACAHTLLRSLPVAERDSRQSCGHCGGDVQRLLSRPSMASVGGTGNKRPSQ